MLLRGGVTPPKLIDSDTVEIGLSLQGDAIPIAVLMTLHPCNEKY